MQGQSLYALYIYIVNHTHFDVNAALDVSKQARKGMSLDFQGGGFKRLFEVMDSVFESMFTDSAL